MAKPVAEVFYRRAPWLVNVVPTVAGYCLDVCMQFLRLMQNCGTRNAESKMRTTLIGRSGVPRDRYYHNVRHNRQSSKMQTRNAVSANARPSFPSLHVPSLFPNFRCHGNGDRSDVNFNNTSKLLDCEKLLFGVTSMSLCLILA